MSTPNDNLEERFERAMRNPVNLLVVGGVLLLIFSAWLWWAKVYTGPRAVFAAMLANNLSTQSLTARQVSSEQNGVKIDKRSQVQYAPKPMVRIVTTTEAAETYTTVKTETISSPDKEFNRYTSIKTSQANVPDPKTYLNQWAEGSQGATAYSQTLLRPYGIPFGYVQAQDRTKLMDFLKDNEVFQTTYAVDKKTIKGRLQYTYTVNIQPVAYIAFLKGYANSLGLKDLDDVDPKAAQGTQAIPVRLTVDVRSHRLVKAEYSGLGYTEYYSDFNVPRSIATPKATFSAAELQNLVAGPLPANE